jgi:hypothetical protein
MAQVGFYTDPPGRRLAYDQDGTVVLYVNQAGADIYELDQADREAMNDESSTTYFSAGNNGMGVSDSYDIVFLFPERRNLTHMYAVIEREIAPQGHPVGDGIYWSDDTTNGVDGTWTLAHSEWTTNANSGLIGARPEHREELESISISSATAVKFTITSSNRGFGSDNILYALHLYGMKAAGETPHRIDFVVPGGSELTQDFDYGDQARGSSAIWNAEDGYNIGAALALRNRSPDMVAQNVIVTVQALTFDMNTRIRFSTDNGASWLTQIEYPEIQPLAITGHLWVRHEIEEDAALGLYVSRLKIDVGSWE